MTRVREAVSAACAPRGADAPAARLRTMVAAVVRTVLVAACLSCGLSAQAGLPGEDPLAIKDAIGRGMHDFHGGNFDRAYDEFTNAIEAGTADPRAYYFRGLAALRLGRTAEAEADFSAGAEREAVDGSTLRVSRALQRVQGCDRLTLERFRTRARLAGLQRDQEAAARRYSTIEDPSEDLRRRRRPEDVDGELLAPRRGSDVEEVPPPRPASPRGRPRTPFGDNDDASTDAAAPRAGAPDGDAEEGEKEMASEPEEKMADEDAKESEEDGASK